MIAQGTDSSVNLATVYNNRALADYYKGVRDPAIADFNQALRLKPDYAEAYFRRGNVYGFIDKPDYDLAIADYTQAIRLNPRLSRSTAAVVS